MPYVRKTIDVFEVHVDYGQGYEEVHSEFSYYDALATLKDYRQNTPEYPAKIKRGREPKTNYTPEQLEKIAEGVKEARKRHWERVREKKKKQKQT